MWSWNQGNPPIKSIFSCLIVFIECMPNMFIPFLNASAQSHFYLSIEFLRIWKKLFILIALFEPLVFMHLMRILIQGRTYLEVH